MHPLVGDAVYQAVSSGERELHHERAAAVLQSRGATPEQVAAHVILAPLRGSADAVRVLRLAAETAADRGAADAAVDLPASGRSPSHPRPPTGSACCSSWAGWAP